MIDTTARQVTPPEEPSVARSRAQAAVTLRAPEENHSSFATQAVGDALRQAVLHAELEISGAFAFPYEPIGLSCGLHGPEFHVFLHTWPEHGMATLDLLVLGRTERAESVLRGIEARLGWRRCEDRRLRRLEGQPNGASFVGQIT